MGVIGNTPARDLNRLLLFSSNVLEIRTVIFAISLGEVPIVPEHDQGICLIFWILAEVRETALYIDTVLAG